MKIKQFLPLLLLFLALSCTQDNDVLVSRNLQQFVEENNNVQLESVNAFAANAASNTNLVYIFYYPEEGATNVRYYELTDPSLDKTDFVNYRRQSLNSETVFGGKLARFTRSSSIESWCLVTYFLDGELKISSPVKLENTSNSTQYSDEVTINYKTITEPNFSWEDTAVSEKDVYFQVISDEENNFISGTYTTDNFFQYYDISNVTLNINTETPAELEEDEIYNFTMMLVNADNWVNLIIEEQFIPRNLEEYIANNNDKEILDIFAFGSSANGNIETTLIYYQPVEGAFDFRYYETESTAASINKNDFSNYRRKNLSSTIVLGNQFRRFSNNSSDEVWCVVTYRTENALYISDPIKTKNKSDATDWTTAVAINTAERLQPVFTWQDDTSVANTLYFQVFTTEDNSFLSGTFTTEKTFQYYNEANTVNQNIHTIAPPDLVLDNQYKFSLFGISEDNWANLIIQNNFIAE